MLEVQVTKSLEHCTVARMIALVTVAQAAKAPSERFSAWFCQRYTIAVLVETVIALGVFYWLGQDFGDFALPRSDIAGRRKPVCDRDFGACRHPVGTVGRRPWWGAIQGRAALETRAAVDIFAFDKTGTLTSGRVDVTEIVTLDGSETDFRTLEQHVERQMAGANVLDADRYQLVVMLDYHSARVPW